MVKETPFYAKRIPDIEIRIYDPHNFIKLLMEPSVSIIKKGICAGAETIIVAVTTPPEQSFHKYWMVQQCTYTKDSDNYEIKYCESDAIGAIHGVIMTPVEIKETDENVSPLVPLPTLFNKVGEI